jgi:hypothetical protein
MEPLNNTPSDSNPIRTMAFSGDGNTIYTATKDSLKSYAWETTVKMKGHLEIGWDKIAELRVSADGNTLTAGSFNSNFVSIWSVDLDKVNNSTNTNSDGKYISQQQRVLKSKAVPGNRNEKYTNKNSSTIDVDYEADSKSLEALSLEPSVSAKTEENSPEMHWESEEARNVMESSMSLSLQRKLEEHRRKSSERSYTEQSQVDDKENTPSSVDAIQNMLPPSRYIIDSPSSSSAVDRDRKTGVPPSSPSDQRSHSNRGRAPTGLRGHTPLKGPARSAASDRDQSDYMSYADINGDQNSPLKIRGLNRNASVGSIAEAKVNREDPTLRAAARRAAAAAGSSNVDQSNRGTLALMKH